MRVSQCVLGSDGAALVSEASDEVLSTASVGKLFLLAEAAEQIADGHIDPLAPVTRDPAQAVADSGLWQHLATDALPLHDVCVLVAAASDNWATNVLLQTVGLEASAARAQALGCTRSALLRPVRGERLPDDPAALSVGTVGELAGAARRIHRAAAGEEGQGISPAAARVLEPWLLTGVDLSLVAAPLCLDPLAHSTGPLVVWSKTGCDVGVRADVGVAWTGDDYVAYAAIANWSGDEPVEGAFERMHGLGRLIRERLR